jgi:septal ring factor EnvC (AmiA/AmiB activator)
MVGRLVKCLCLGLAVLIMVSLMAGCAARRPCEVPEDQVEMARGKAASVEKELDQAKKSISELEAQIKAKKAAIAELEAQKAELEKALAE